MMPAPSLSLGSRGAALLLSLALAGLPAAPQATPAPAAQGEPWRILPQRQSSKVYAADGSLIGQVGQEWRTVVTLASLPRYVAQAFIAIEDHRFYQHDGVDLVGVAGAIKDAMRGRVRGASTITQLLVGNMHPDLVDRTDVSLGRKIREQQAAREMERHYSKEQILEAFLNQLHFGRRIYGIESAARHYFGKSSAQLSLAEAATLAAMPKGPGIYDPVRHPDRTRQRRNVVLARMSEESYLTLEQARAAQAEPLVTVKDLGFTTPAGYFVDVVRVQAARTSVSVADGGFRIHTTLEPVLQRAAHAALRETAADVESRPGYAHPRYDPSRTVAGYLQGAVVALDPFTGDVRALVGGRDYAQSPFNRAVNGMRQPGSAFKPFVYAAAVAESLTASTIVGDTAITITLPNGRTYRPRNADGTFLGPLTLREALVRSRNPVAVQLAERYGIDSVIALAHAAGINSPIAAVPSSAIGASVVQPLDLVAAYATFANLGARVEARFITRIEDAEGRVVHANRVVDPTPALDAGVAFIVRDMMRDAVDHGTAAAVRHYVPEDVPVAGKTGTTDDNSDVWFVGMTPDLVAGVWLGFDRPRGIAPGVAGGTLAAPVFGRMLEMAMHVGAGVPWLAPEGVVPVELDRETGQVATPATPFARRYTEYFLAGTEPAELRMDVFRLLKGVVVY